MIFIGGISQGQKILDYVKTVICDRCGDLVLFSSKLHTEVNTNVYFVDILSGREAM